MDNKRTKRLNSLLQEVITDVIKKEVRNPLVSPLFSITEVDISKDLQHAKVYISVIGTPEEKQQTIKALQSAAGFISILASKQITIRFFPSLIFKLDTSVDKQMKIDSILKDIQEEKESRDVHEEN